MARQRAQAFQERALCRGLQILVVETQDQVLRERPPYLLEGLIVEMPEVNAGHFRTERTGKWRDSN